MHHSAIASAYDTIADIWLDDRFNRTDGIRQHKQALGFLHEESEGWVLSVGCGCNTRFNTLFRERKLQVEGVDISEKMVALSRVADPSATVHLADICTWEPTRNYQLISAWDSIWHVHLSEQRPLMQKLLGLLEPGGVFIFSAGGLDSPSEHTDAAMGPPVYYGTLGIPELLRVIHESHCTCRHLEFDQHPQSHIYIIAQKPPNRSLDPPRSGQA